ncbi:MAG: heme ABC transporter ATP-binding protein [Rhodothermales bacterium]
MLRLDDISVQIGDKSLVQNVSLDVKPGRVTALVGPNGAGKSTLLRVATGERPPTTGQVLFDDRPLAQWATKTQAQRRAVVAQHSSLTFPFPVFEVVLMGRTPHLSGRGESKHDVDIARAALERVGLAHLADQAYTTLSGGERQRVDLARALAQIWEATGDAARYLFLDEPTASLDLAQQHETLRIARDVAAQDVGVLVILHDLNLAAQYADEIVMLRDGRCCACGIPHDVLVPDMIESVFSLPVMVTPHPCHDCPLVVPLAHPMPPAAIA